MLEAIVDIEWTLTPCTAKSDVRMFRQQQQMRRRHKSVALQLHYHSNVHARPLQWKCHTHRPTTTEHDHITPEKNKMRITVLLSQNQWHSHILFSRSKQWQSQCASYISCRLLVFECWPKSHSEPVFLAFLFVKWHLTCSVPHTFLTSYAR